MGKASEVSEEEGQKELGWDEVLDKIESVGGDVGRTCAELAEQARDQEEADKGREATTMAISAGASLFKGATDNDDAIRAAEALFRRAAVAAQVWEGAPEEGTDLLDGCNRGLAEALTWLGHAQCRLGRYGEAESSYEEAARAVEYFSVAERSCRLQWCCTVHREYTGDASKHEEAVERWRRVVEREGQDDPEVDRLTAEVMVSMERVRELTARGRLAEAYEEGKAELLEKAHKAARTSPLRRFDALPSLADAHSLMSKLCNRLGDPASTERHCRAAVWEQAADCGLDMPQEAPESGLPETEGLADQDLASSLKNLGDFLLSQGRFAQAADCYARVEPIVRSEPAERAAILYKLGTAYARAGGTSNAQAALECLDSSLHFAEQAFGRDSEPLVQTLIWRAQAKWLLSNLSAAAEDLERAFQLGRRLLGDEHAQTRKALSNLTKAKKRLSEQGSAVTNASASNSTGPTTSHGEAAEQDSGNSQPSRLKGGFL